MFKKILLAASAAGVLAACAGPDRWDVDAVGALTPPADPAFNAALHRDYTALAGAERGRYDWCDTAFFLDKASAAAAGETVLPTEVASRNLAASVVDGATVARADLMAVLEGNARTSKPTAAARAQAGFDCWVEELEEGHQPAAIAACRAMFDDAMAELKAVPEPAPEPALGTGPFLVFFETGSARLDSSAREVLASAAQAYEQAGDVVVVIAGHTDTVGAADSNMLLSQRRAEAVADALALLGVAPREMALEAYGQEQLMVPTPDGANEGRNRRVEITFRDQAR